MTRGRTEVLDHPADLRLRFVAPDEAELGATAVRGLAAWMADGAAPRPDGAAAVDLTGTDATDLLVQLLNECLFLLETRRTLAVDLEVDEYGDTALRGTLRLADLARGPVLLRGVKAATYGAPRWDVAADGTITAELTFDL